MRHFFEGFFSQRSADPAGSSHSFTSPLAQLREVVENFKRYLNARIALALAEADDLTKRLKSLAILVFLALVSAIMLALSLEVAALALILFLTDWDLLWAALLLAGVHLLVLLILALLLRSRSKFQAFPHTRSLIKETEPKPGYGEPPTASAHSTDTARPAASRATASSSTPAGQ